MAVDELRQMFPVVIELPVAWGEMDAFGHVNNIVYFRYFESARIAYFERVGVIQHMNETRIGPILASTQCRFRAPLMYPDTVSVGTRVHSVEADRFTMDYRVVSHKSQTVAAEGSGLIVMYDYSKNTKVTIPDTLRERMTEIEQSVAGRKEA